MFLEMKNLLYIILLLLLGFVIMQGCHKEVHHNIPIEFEVYVNKFFYEAESRELDLHLRDVSLSIEFAQLPIDKAAQCRSSKHLIEVKKQAWNKLSNDQKEHLITHELGHCLLNRKHRNELSASGEDISIMQGKNIGSFNLVSEKWEQYYYDELFNPYVPLPDWHFSNIQSMPSMTQVFNVSLFIKEILIDTIAFDSFSNFSICVTYKNWRELTEILELQLGNVSLLYADNGGVKIQNDLGVLFSSKRMSIDGDIKFEIRKINQDVYFLVNNDYFHCFEYSFIIGNDILIDFGHNYVEVNIELSK